MDFKVINGRKGPLDRKKEEPILNDFVIPTTKTRKSRVLNPDELIEYLTEVNEFLNHRGRPFRQIADRDMIL